MASEKITVAVGMSGGVDSTAAAYLLKEAGHDVFGITMKIWEGETGPTTSAKGGCYGPSEAHDIAEAQAICERLDIPHHIIDLAEEFSRSVLDNFSSEYMAGRTPNPCVLCNHFMKFGTLLEKTRAEGFAFDRFATGHYARIAHDGARHLLLKAADPRKDQSYFLYRLTQPQLAQSLFPLGGYTKPQVKETVRAAGFTDVVDKPESQNFTDDGEYQKLLNADHSTAGLILNLEGKVLGEHQGIHNFTIGQRKGLAIGGSKEPLYVIRISASDNTVVLGPRAHLAVDRLTAIHLNWIAVEKIVEPLAVTARLRSNQKEIACVISPSGDKVIEVAFEGPQYAAALGQSIVFYQGDTVIGGGIIQSTHRVIEE